MSGATIIRLEGVTKGYQFYHTQMDILREVLFGGTRHDTFWALRDIDLKISEGERVGIVGPNGAGKSTLLQIIAGTLQPTAGTVSVSGKISPLLSLTPSWNLGETGVENIRFNLLMQGVESEKIPGLVEDVIDFTELGAFIYRPVRTYSSGMSARLAFGIATAVDPEILIIDEVLGVGDGYFAAKAHIRLQQFCARGRALLFVSHAPAAVRQMCDRAVWIEGGSIRLDGKADYVLAQYELDCRKVQDLSIRAGNIEHAANRIHMGTAADLSDDTGRQQFRIVAHRTTLFSATHYVRKILVGVDGNVPVEVPLCLPSGTPQDDLPALDVVGSEWGRIHERGTDTCRMLARRTGRRVGGHFSLPIVSDRQESDVEIEIESACPDAPEPLMVEWFDLANGKWCSLAESSRTSLGREWVRATFTGIVRSLEGIERAKAVASVKENALPDAEIVSVSAHSADGEAYVFREQEPFWITVHAFFRRPIPLVDVTLKLMSVDGVHAFWISLGEQGRNLEEPSGYKDITFRFDPNYLGEGEYFVTTHIASEFSYPDKWPHEMVYARALNVIKIVVKPERYAVNKGVLNQPIEILVSDAKRISQEKFDDGKLTDTLRVGPGPGTASALSRA